MATATAPPPAARTGLWLTTEGWLWFGILVLLMIVSIAKSINLLALLGSLLFAVLVLCLLGVGGGLRRLVARRIPDDPIVAGFIGEVVVRLALPRGRRLRGLRVEEAGQGHALAWYFDEFAPGAAIDLVGQLVCPVRGWYAFAPLAVSSRYPFGLIARRAVLAPALRLLVLPRPGKLSRERMRQHLRGFDPRGDRALRRGVRHETAQADFHGLRSFRPGDSPRWIHWRSSARRGELLVREFEDVPGDDLFLVVDPVCPPGGDFEAVVSLAAAIVHAWCHHRGERLVVALPGTAAALLDGPTGPEHGRAVLEALALATPADGADPTPALAAASWLGTHVGAVVVSWGDSALAAPLQAALGRPALCLDVTRHHEWGFYTPP